MSAWARYCLLIGKHSFSLIQSTINIFKFQDKNRISKFLERMGTFSCLSAIFTNRKNFCDFLFALLEMKENFSPILVS